ncbi:serine-threonine protein kinase, plant-type, putative, partial [Ricinus communis]
LKHLEDLDISFNSLSGNLPWCLANLTSLQQLDLSSNHFNGSLSPLSSLTSIYYLYLSDNMFQIPISLNPFVNLSKLILFYGFERLSTLENLEILDLSINNFNNSVLSSFSNFTSLKSLYIDSNKLKGTLNVEELLKLNNLEYLDLSFNHFDNGVLSFLKGLSSLKTLDISYNQLKGPFDLKELKAWSKLEKLSLGGNEIDEFTSSTGFPIFRNLQHLYLNSSILNNSFLQSIGTLTSLKALSLPKCGLTSTIPSTQGLCELKYLKGLDISFNSLSETEVEDMIPKFQLKMLYLPGDGYGGAFPKFLYYQHDLEVIDLWNFRFRESFHGRIPMQIGAYFSSLTELKMSRSGFHGSIPNSIGNMSSLTYMDLSNNQFSGNVPNLIENMPSLYVLALTTNDISGSLPSNFSLSSISEIHLSRNRIQGSLEHAFLCGSDLLMVLDLSHNHMTGSIPSWIGGLPQLDYLILSNNNFDGKIPI